MSKVSINHVLNARVKLSEAEGLLDRAKSSVEWHTENVRRIEKGYIDECIENQPPSVPPSVYYHPSVNAVRADDLENIRRQSQILNTINRGEIPAPTEEALIL